MTQQPTKPNLPNNVAVPSSIDEYILAMYRSGRKEAAKQTEMAARAANPLFKCISLATEEWLDKYIGTHPSVVRLKDDIRKLSAESDSVLIAGPTGTGKELVAHALHGSRTGKFVGINCTALPSELIESELFGHKKGAFTGATSDRHGKFKEAWGGTLFLDEIGDMPLLMQSKLLRVLQEREYNPLGGEEVEKVNCRVVAATNKTIGELLDAGKFRSDLYYRLAIFTLETVSLADRLEDLAEIVDHYGGHELWTKFESIVNNPVDAGGADLSASEFFDLAGNVRSLQAQIRRWQVLGR